MNEIPTIAVLLYTACLCLFILVVVDIFLRGAA